MPNAELPNVVQMSPDYVWRLSLLATAGLVVMWSIFWLVVWLKKENIMEILKSDSFFKTITVMGVIAATVVLSLADKIAGDLTGAILSGIVGYVLGTNTKRGDRIKSPPE